MHRGCKALLAVAMMPWTAPATGSGDENHPGLVARAKQECSSGLQGSLSLLQTGTRKALDTTHSRLNRNSLAASTNVTATLPEITKGIQDSNSPDVHVRWDSSKSNLVQLLTSGVFFHPDLGNSPPELSHAQQLMNKIREGCQSHTESWCGPMVRFELHRIAVAYASLILDFVLVAWWICQVKSHEPFVHEQRTSYALAAHIIIAIVETTLLLAIVFFPGAQRPYILRGLLAFELAFAFSASPATQELRSSNRKENRLVGTSYLLLASLKLGLAALMMASPASITLLFAHFFAHHTGPWAQAFVWIFQRLGLFPEHPYAVATVASLLVVLPCGLGICSGGALVVLSAGFLVFAFGSRKKKPTAVPWFSQSQDHGQEESSGREGHEQDASVARDSDTVGAEAHPYSKAQLHAEKALFSNAEAEVRAEEAEANFHHEASVASMAYSRQEILEDEVQAERNKGRAAEAALAQLAVEHTRLVAVRDELELERNRGQEADMALAHRTNSLGVEIMRLQVELETAQATQETIAMQHNASEANCLIEAEEVQRLKVTLAQAVADDARTEASKKLLLEEIKIAQSNCLAEAEEVKRLKSTLAQAVAKEARTEASKLQFLEELNSSRQQLTSEVWQQDADVKVALLKSEATAQAALEEYQVATSKALQNSIESECLRSSLASVEAEMASSRESMTVLQGILEEQVSAADEAAKMEASMAQDMECLGLDMRRLSSTEAQLRKELEEEKVRPQWNPTTISAATQAGNGLIAGLLADRSRELDEDKIARQTAEITASERVLAVQNEELRISKRATSSMHTEWQNAEAFLAAAEGLTEGLEVQNAELHSENAKIHSEMDIQRVNASNEQDQIQHLRRQVQILEEELDLREDQLIRAEPLVVLKGQGTTDPRTASTSPAKSSLEGTSSPSRQITNPQPFSVSPLRSFLSEANLQPAQPLPMVDTRSPSSFSKSPSKGIYATIKGIAPDVISPWGEGSTARPFESVSPSKARSTKRPSRSASPMDMGVRTHPSRSASPMERRHTPQKTVPWLPPGRAQSFLTPSSAQSLPSSSKELRPVTPSSAQSLPSSAKELRFPIRSNPQISRQPYQGT